MESTIVHFIITNEAPAGETNGRSEQRSHLYRNEKGGRSEAILVKRTVSLEYKQKNVRRSFSSGPMLDLRLLASGGLLVISRVSTADRVFISTTQKGSTLGSTLKLVATKKKSCTISRQHVGSD